MSTWMNYRGIRVPSATPANEAGRVLKSDLMTLADRSAMPDWGAEAPTDFVATPASGSVVQLSWDNNALFPAQFVIERSSVGLEGPWTSIHTTAAGVTSYYNSGLTPETTYYYRLRGKFGPFYSGALTAQATTTNTTSLPFTLNEWTNGITGVTSYKWKLRFPKSYSGVTAQLTFDGLQVNVACNVNTTGLRAAIAPWSAAGHWFDGNFPPVVNDAGSEWEWLILFDSNHTSGDPGHFASEFS